MAKFWKAINEFCVTSAQFNKPLFFNNLGMSLDGMSLKEARKLLDSIKEKLELVLSKNRDSEIITNGNSHEKNGNSTIIQNQNGDSKKENNDSQQPKEDGKKCFVHLIFRFWFLVTFGENTKILRNLCKARWARWKKTERKSHN